MRRGFVIAFATCLVAISTPGIAQRPEAFTARLDWVPIGGTERNDVSGEGSLSAKLSGTKLTITGSFTGLPAKVTGAKLHAGVATGARGRGLVVADQSVGQAMRGAICGATATDAEMCAPGSAEILERAADPLVGDLNHHVSITSERTELGRRP